MKTPFQSAVKSVLLKNGFADVLVGDSGKKRQLPDTTVVVMAEDGDAALERFRRLAETVSPSVGVVERAIAVPAVPCWLHAEVVK
ncbi:hypothetical protein VZQ01_06760 [Myxococcus faecalis]|uniref:hypothetical protein n=1 Tax=Myxococcus faecalis TaxID=3115646 RepID=UPI003CEE4871